MMKLYLTSNASLVIDKIAKDLGKLPESCKVVFIPTAGNVYDETPWIDDDKKALKKLGYKISVLDIEGKNQDEIKQALVGTDIIFVAGGNTFYLLKQSQKSGFNQIVKSLVRQGIVYIGSSAGSVIAGPNIEPVAVSDDPSGIELESTLGFGLVNFVALPHFGKEKYGSYHQQVLKDFSDKYKILPISDERYIFSDGKNYKII